MNKFKRPIIVNAIVVMMLILLDYFFVAPKSGGLFFSGVFIALLAPVNFVIGMIRNRQRKGDGQYYFLVSGVLLLIGFSVCSQV